MSLVTTNDVLIVEDSLTQALQIQNVLSERGFSCIIARDGEEALRLLESMTPALVLCDIIMPGMDGYEVCSRIKQTPALSHIPVVLLTQLSDPSDIIRGLQARADCYSTKPYSPEFLVSTIENLLSNRSLQAGEEADELKVLVSGKTYSLKADRLQMVNLLLSVYGSAVQRNRELQESQAVLQALNAELADKQLKLREANEKLETLATQDSLTGLKNRRAFMEKLHEEMYRSQRQGTALSLALLDLDHFKLVNDELGHLVGDQTLEQIAVILRDTTRQMDTLGRYGGEEFILLMPATDKASALVFGERIRRHVAAGDWPHRRITASIGLTTLDPGQGVMAMPAFIDQADRALYEAKSRGRNKVVHYQDLPRE